MPVIAIYARTSRDREDKRVSIRRQVERCTKRANDLFPGVEVRAYDKDNNKSGADPDVVREDYERLLNDIRRGQVAQVVVHEQSRLTRQPQQWNQLVVILTRAGIEKIHTV